MRVTVISKTPGFEYKKELQYCPCSRERYLDDVKDEINSVLRDELWDFYSNVISGCPVVPRGSFVEADIYSYVIGYMKETILANKGIWTAECTLITDNQESAMVFTIDFTDILMEMLEFDSSTGEFNSRLGSYVENCLLKFEKCGEWHISRDAVWFGTNSESADHPWSIDSQTEKDELAIWFEHDSYEFMKLIGDFSENFLFWYVYECGCCIPNIESIRKSCPISIEEADSSADILKKAAIYLTK